MVDCPAVNPSNFFTLYVAPLASPLIALLVGSIAYQQWVTSQEKLRLDLYNRRFDIFMRAMDFMHVLHDWQGTPKDEQRSKRIAFIKACRESQFLFSKESGIFELMNEMNVRSFKWTGIGELAKHASYMPVQFKASYDEGLESLFWIERTLTELEVRMAPYLNFHQLQTEGIIAKLERLADQDIAD